MAQGLSGLPPRGVPVGVGRELSRSPFPGVPVGVGRELLSGPPNLGVPVGVGRSMGLPRSEVLGEGRARSWPDPGVLLGVG